MSTYNKNAPLTPKQIARINRMIRSAHRIGGPAFKVPPKPQ